MSDVTITTLPDGPYLVTGTAMLVDTQGNELTVDGEKFALCRCGASSRKPFCDGAHKEIGFVDGSTDQG